MYRAKQDGNIKSRQCRITTDIKNRTRVVRMEAPLGPLNIRMTVKHDENSCWILGDARPTQIQLRLECLDQMDPGGGLSSEGVMYILE